MKISAFLLALNLAAATSVAATNTFMLRRIDFEEGDNAGAAMANGKDKTIVSIDGAQGVRALHVKLGAGSPQAGSQARLSSFLGFFHMPLEEGKTFVFKFSMKSDFPQSASLHFGIDQKGVKDGAMKYFSVAYPDPSIARTRVIGGTSDWKDYSYEFRPASTNKTECATVCYIYATIGGPEGTEAWIDNIELWEKPMIYQAGFGGEAAIDPSGWTPSGKDALLDENAGHSALGSLKLHADGNTVQSPYWESPDIPVPDPDIFLSCWIRDRLTF
ncbi:MAG: hypothetical protein PHR35_20645, partial [Kiritimatiellae bacterium]|nr:hypothetical protein [Kiritimatiellia bacterium]